MAEQPDAVLPPGGRDARRAGRARDDGQRRGLAEAERRSASAALASLGDAPRPSCASGTGAGLVLTGKPFVFAVGADLTEFPGDRRRSSRAAGGEGGHDALRGDPRPARSPRSPRSTAPRSAAGSRSPSTATSARSPARSATSASPRSSSGSSPAGAARSSSPRLVGAERGRRADRREPAQAEPAASTRRGRPSSASSTRSSTTSSSSTTRSSGSCDAIEEGARTRGRDADLVRRGRGLREGAVRASTTPCTASRSAPYRALDLIAGAATWSLEEGYARGGGRARRPPPRPAGAGRRLRLRPRRAADQEAASASPTRSRAGSQRVGVVGAGLMATQLATLFLRRLEVPVVITDVDAGAGRGGGRVRSAPISRSRSSRGPARRGQGALPRLDRQRVHRTPRASPAATS